MKKSNSDRKTELLRRLRDRMAALAAGPRLHHAVVYIPDPDETGARDLFPPIGAMPVGPRNAPDSRVTPTRSCWRIDTERTDSEDGFARWRALKPATLELIWTDKADEQHAENAAGAWLKIAADLWARLSPDDWGPFRVSPEIGPSLGASTTACDWGRLLHLAAWSGRVPGLRTRIRRFNTLWPDRGWSRFADEETGSPADDFTVTPILPGVPVEFEASTYYASILYYDAVGDSLALIDHLLNPTGRTRRPPEKARTLAEWIFLEAAFEADGAMFGIDLARKAGYKSYKTTCKKLCDRGDLEKPSERGGYAITERGRRAIRDYKEQSAPKNP